MQPFILKGITVDKLICIGKILKPQGIKGECKAEFYSDNIQYYKNLKKITVNNNRLNILDFRLAGSNYVFLSLENINSRNKAEELRNKELFVEYSEIAPLEKGKWYINDIIGCSVLAGNDKIGIVKDVLQNGAADVLYVEGINNNCMFPFLNRVINSVDIEKRVIVLNKQAFEEVVLYEN